MTIKLGTIEISNLMLGTTQVDKVMLGTTQVWGYAPVIPVGSTQVLLHGNAFTDSSLHDLPINYRNLSLNVLSPFASQYAKGSYRLSLTSSSSLEYIEIESDDLPADLDDMAFTIDFWIYTSANPSGATILFTKDNSRSDTKGYTFGLNTPSGGNMQFTFVFSYLNGATVQRSVVAMPTQVPHVLNAWRHVALVKQSNLLKLYVMGSLAYTHNFGVSQNFPVNDGWFYVGAPFATVQGLGSLGRFNGYMSEFRISSVARWTGNFTPQTMPYEPD